MEVRSVLTTSTRPQADSACEELRGHGIKCDTFEPDLPEVDLPYWLGGSVPDPGIQVVVAPEDESRAKDILNAWLRTVNEARPS